MFSGKIIEGIGYEYGLFPSGYAYIKFAMDEPNLFEMLFLSDIRYDYSMYEILNGKNGVVGAEMTKARNAGVADSGDLFTKMWIFIHGIACMSVTGDYDLDESQTFELLVDTAKGFLK